MNIFIPQLITVLSDTRRVFADLVVLIMGMNIRACAWLVGGVPALTSICGNLISHFIHRKSGHFICVMSKVFANVLVKDRQFAKGMFILPTLNLTKVTFVKTNDKYDNTLAATDSM